MDRRKAQRMLWAFGKIHIPMISYVKPQIAALDKNRIVIKLKLKKRTRNHLGTMYFGALNIGAEIAAGLPAFIAARENQQKLLLIFRDFHADFIKRPDDDVYFISENGEQIRQMLSQCENSGERVTQTLKVEARLEPENPESTVARFKLGLSLRLQK